MDKQTKTQTSNPVETAFKGMMDEESIRRMGEVPTQAFDMMMEAGKKMQEASLDYARQVERIQREYWQGVTRVMGTMLPGESKVWEAQVKAVESGFDMVERMMAVGAKK
ncbi:MAG: hypothetical protein ACO1RX_10235 [Candidatus Sericytochromatia bacterium]